eukprot:1194252-Prorocentrum_minimum.AAC.8
MCIKLILTLLSSCTSTLSSFPPHTWPDGTLTPTPSPPPLSCQRSSMQLKAADDEGISSVTLDAIEEMDWERRCATFP